MKQDCTLSSYRVIVHIASCQAIYYITYTSNNVIIIKFRFLSSGSLYSSCFDGSFFQFMLSFYAQFCCILSTCLKMFRLFLTSWLCFYKHLENIMTRFRITLIIHEQYKMLHVLFIVCIIMFN